MLREIIGFPDEWLIELAVGAVTGAANSLLSWHADPIGPCPNGGDLHGQLHHTAGHERPIGKDRSLGRPCHADSQIFQLSSYLSRQKPQVLNGSYFGPLVATG